MQTQNIKAYQIYQGRSKEKIQIFIEVDMLTLEEAEEKLKTLSTILEQRLVKQWKCLPSSSLPIEYNIATLPYAALVIQGGI